MSRLSRLLIILYLVCCTLAKIRNKNYSNQCQVSKISRSNAIQFNCFGLTSMSDHLNKAPANTSEITIVESKINEIQQFTFVRFAATLRSLELRSCDITFIDVNGFGGLVFLEKLILWDNKLTWIPSEMFRPIPNLRHLDLSSNDIYGIDNAFYQMLPNLETFYFDHNQLQSIEYNLFPLLGKLKKVSFGNNPWNWGYRVLLTWQFDNAKIDYQEDWQEWGWMSHMVRECQEAEQQFSFNDTVLDCATQKFLRMEIDDEYFIPSSGNLIVSSNPCPTEADSLIRCSFQASPKRESVRRILEGLISDLGTMIMAEMKLKKFL